MRREVGPKSGAAVASAIAVVVLAGKLVGSGELQSFGGAQTMRTATAIGLMLAAAALLWRRELGVPLGLGGVVALVVGEVVAVNTAVCFVLLGVAVVCLDRSVRGAD